MHKNARTLRVQIFKKGVQIQKMNNNCLYVASKKVINPKKVNIMVTKKPCGEISYVRRKKIDDPKMTRLVNGLKIVQNLQSAKIYIANGGEEP